MSRVWPRLISVIMQYLVGAIIGAACGLLIGFVFLVVGFVRWRQEADMHWWFGMFAFLGAMWAVVLFARPRPMSQSESLDRQARWPWSLIPWRVDHETLVVSDVLALTQAGAMGLSLVDGPWVVFLAGLVAIAALFFQVLLSAGIFGVKLFAIWPPVGHAAMYADPQPILEVSWFRAMRGLLASVALIGVWFAVSHLRSVT